MSKLFLVPTPVGNLKDMTFRAIKVLQEANLILAEDTRTSGKLLQHYQIQTPCKAYHQFNEHKICQQVVEWLKGGQTIAVITDAGTPGISDPGFLLVRACAENNIEVECLPGATAFVPALVQSGLACERFIFEGFLPHQKGRNARLEQLRYQEKTMIIYESPHRISKTLEQLSSVLGRDRKACLCREISKIYAESRRQSLGELCDFYKENEPKGEMVLVVEGFKGNTFTYAYPRPSVTADFILTVKKQDGSRHLLLVKRKKAPFENTYAFPGGFLEENETLEWCATRELKEETGLRCKDWGIQPLPFKTFSEPLRDPRGRTVTMVYHASLLCDELPDVKGMDDASEASWFDINQLPPLAFDHQQIWEEYCQSGKLD